MQVTETQLTVTQILEDLDNGLTWYKKDDAGYGSIQEKYKARDQQIAVIRKHPKLKDAETSLTIFTIIDDTVNERDTTTVSASNGKNEQAVGSVPGSETIVSEQTSGVPGISNPIVEKGTQSAPEPTATVEESADAFFDL